MKIAELISTVDNHIRGAPLTVLLVGTGLYLTVRLTRDYFARIKAEGEMRAGKRTTNPPEWTRMSAGQRPPMDIPC